MGSALAASGASPDAVSSPGVLHRQPHNVAAPIVAAYSESLSEVFFWAAPVAVVGFVVALFLREVPLRDIHNSAIDLGDGFGMPTTDTPERLLENAIARMLRGDPGVRLRSIAMRPDCRLDVPGLWGVMRIYRYGQMYGTARLSDIGNNLRIPFEVLEPTFGRLAATGYVRRDGDQMWLTPAGARQIDYVYSLLMAWIVDKLARSPSYHGRPDRREVEAALEHIAHRVLAQRDWHDDAPTTVQLSAGVGGRR
jgi:hypothetical protein